MSDARLERLVAALRALELGAPRIAFVLGSGQGAFARRLARARSFACERIDGMPCASVPGHAGVLVAGELQGEPVLVLQGRVHLYEGWSAREVALAVRALAALGCRALVLTNAAGGLVPAWPPGTLMRVRDHLNLQGASPLAASEAGYGCPYDAALGSALEAGAAAAGVPLERGIYAGLRGPAYETPAEIRMLRDMGAHAVGMSTVVEALAGCASGMRVAALALITNPAAGLADRPLSHQDVLASGAAATGRLSDVLASALPHLAATLAA